MSSEAAPGLVDVNGIGETYAGLLAEVGIQDATELARQDADDLAARLTDAGHVHGAQRVAKWIQEARRVTAGDEREGDRRQLASFTVFLEGDEAASRPRIRIYHEESGEQRSIDGIEPSALLRFMLVDALSSTTDPVPTAFREAARRAVAEQEHPAVARSVDGVTVAIMDVTVGTVSPPQRRLEPWLEVVVSFDVAGLEHRRSASDVAYLCEVLLIDRATRTLRTIVSRYGQLDHGDDTYGARQELPLPPVGSYDVETVVLLLPPAEAVACRSGRPLTITP